MRFYGYVLLGAFVIISIIGNVGKMQIEKRIEASQQAQESELSAENTDYACEGDTVGGIADVGTGSDSKSDAGDIAGSDSRNNKKSVDDAKKNDGADTANEPSVSAEEQPNTNAEQKHISSNTGKSAISNENSNPANARTTTALNLASSDGETAAVPSPAQPVHTHNWIATTKTKHHEAVTEKIWIIDEAAWDETLYETKNVVICNGCEHEYSRYEEWRDHCSEYFDKGDMSHGSYRIEPREKKPERNIMTRSDTTRSGQLRLHGMRPLPQATIVSAVLPSKKWS